MSKAKNSKVKNQKTAICPRCFSKIHEEDPKCSLCGFPLIVDNEILYLEDLTQDKK